MSQKVRCPWCGRNIYLGTLGTDLAGRSVLQGLAGSIYPGPSAPGATMTDDRKALGAVAVGAFVLLAWAIFAWIGILHVLGAL